jgi:hypothetical protein
MTMRRVKRASAYSGKSWVGHGISAAGKSWRCIRLRGDATFAADGLRSLAHYDAGRRLTATATSRQTLAAPRGMLVGALGETPTAGRANGASYAMRRPQPRGNVGPGPTQGHRTNGEAAGDPARQLKHDARERSSGFRWRGPRRAEAVRSFARPRAPRREPRGNAHGATALRAVPSVVPSVIKGGVPWLARSRRCF